MLKILLILVSLGLIPNTAHAAAPKPKWLAHVGENNMVVSVFEVPAGMSRESFLGPACAHYVEGTRACKERTKELWAKYPHCPGTTEEEGTGLMCVPLELEQHREWEHLPIWKSEAKAPPRVRAEAPPPTDNGETAKQPEQYQIVMQIPIREIAWWMDELLKPNWWLWFLMILVLTSMCFFLWLVLAPIRFCWRWIRRRWGKSLRDKSIFRDRKRRVSTIGRNVPYATS